MLKREGNDSGGILDPASWPARVVLTGYRATGKTVVGELVATKIGYRFLDMDGELVSSLHCSIAEYVRTNGWKVFVTTTR